MTAGPARRIGVGDVVQVAEQHYCYGLGTLTLRVIELGRRERHSDGIWINLRGVELGHPSGPRQRRVLARLDALRIRPVPAPAAHLPVRPGWGCAACGHDWPCPDRRRRLLREYAGNRAALGIYLALQLADAAADLRHLSGNALHARFLGWLRGDPGGDPSQPVRPLPAAER
ncbi:hypothetical protein GA0074695_0230 [Micromonospora viridifaciens]|uniref:Uncharacterized protein n=1 Tax=Micromonospora viridifaciens TaxID=1881 RepID=A0A1C4U7F0_MICVI|nr:hypothetical protein [Micromonospora viridifaciens]SCE67615.1 hypothetical protein GA0074695_0230 [Micromonospora viridifaciens]